MKKTLTSLGRILISSVFVAGCATGNHAKEESIAIERVDSSSVNITHAYITKTSEGLKLRGELKRKQHSHVRVPGHVHIELVDSNGEVIKSVELDTNRKANSDHVAQFQTTLPNEATAGTTVRVIHHDASSHKQEGEAGVWQGGDN